jgi:acetyl esterase/lipase
MKRLLLNLHSGGFVMGDGPLAAYDAIVLASQTGYEVLAIDYRLLPDHPYPAAIDDTMAVWAAVSKTTPPSNIGVYGMSAGGGLAISLVQRARDAGMALPGAVLLDTPWADLSKNGDSRYIDLDRISYDGYVAAIAKLYANGRDLNDPHLSPIYGDFARFPPTFLVTGVRDFLLSDTVRVNSKLRQAGVRTELVVQDGLGHGWLQESVKLGAPEAVAVYSQMAKFFDENLSEN